MTWPSRRALLVVTGVVVLALALATGGWAWYAAEQHRGSTAFAEAMTRVQTANTPRASAEDRAAAIRELEATLARYPSAATAAQAAYHLGNLKYAAQQYGPARGAYEVTLARGATGTIATLARTGIAYAWEAERDFPKASEAFQAALAGLRPGDFFYEELLIDLGRVQELAGQKAEAIETLRRVLKDVPETRRADEIRARLGALGSASP